MEIVRPVKGASGGDHQQQSRTDRHREVEAVLRRLMAAVVSSRPPFFLANSFGSGEKSSHLRPQMGTNVRHAGVACVLLLAVFRPSRALIAVPHPPGAPCSGVLVTRHRPTPSPAWGLRVALRGGSGGDAGEPSWDKKDPAGAAAPGADGGVGTFEPHTFEARCLAAGVGGIEGTAENSQKSVPWNISYMYSLAGTFANLCLEESEGRTCPWHALYSIQDITHGH